MFSWWHVTSFEITTCKVRKNWNRRLVMNELPNESSWNIFGEIQARKHLERYVGLRKIIVIRKYMFFSYDYGKIHVLLMVNWNGNMRVTNWHWRLMIWFISEDTRFHVYFHLLETLPVKKRPHGFVVFLETSKIIKIKSWKRIMTWKM